MHINPGPQRETPEYVLKRETRLDRAEAEGNSVPRRDTVLYDRGVDKVYIKFIGLRILSLN